MIRYPSIRLILDDGTQHGIVSSEEALQMAREKGLDLVTIAPNANPPVCRVMDYGKFKFEKQKKAKEARKKQKDRQFEIKEIVFRPKIEEHDYNVKLKHIKRFLSENNKVKLIMRYRGREMVYQRSGIAKLYKIVSDLEDMCVIEKNPETYGKQQVIIVGPKPA